MTQFAITPASAVRIQRRGPQNVGYSDNLISLLATNCDRQRTGHFLEHKLWVRDPAKGKQLGEWRVLGTYHTHQGWTCELTEEVKELLDLALDMVSLETYLKWIAGETMTRDLAHWSESGVTTARDLADYLDGCVAREKQKGHYLG